MFCRHPLGDGYVFPNMNVWSCCSLTQCWSVSQGNFFKDTRNSFKAELLSWFAQSFQKFYFSISWIFGKLFRFFCIWKSFIAKFNLIYKPDFIIFYGYKIRFRLTETSKQSQIYNAYNKSTTFKLSFIFKKEKPSYVLQTPTGDG